MSDAKGTFEVTVKRDPPYDSADGVMLGRASIDKVFQGDLEGTSHVEMLAAMTPVEGSRAYVAVERVIGKLGEREGSFVLTHKGVAKNGEAHLDCEVVSGSGTGALSGIEGRMTIEIVDGKHLYGFEYVIG